jgi:hypothetical protein
VLIHTIKGNAIVQMLSKAAVLAAMLAASAVPALAQDTSSSVDPAPAAANDVGGPASSAAPNPAPATPAPAPTISIPTITLVGSSMSEADFRDILSNGKLSDHAKDVAALNATSVTIPEIKVSFTTTATADTPALETDFELKDVVLSDVKDGVAGTASIGNMSSGNSKFTFSAGPLSASSFSMAAMLQFYGLVPPPADATTMQPLYKDLQFGGGSLKGDNFSCTFGKVAVAEFDARPLKISFTQMMEAAQQMQASPNNPPAAALSTYVQFILDTFSSYKSTPMTLDGLSCNGTGDTPVTVSVGSVGIDGYQPGIYPAVTAKAIKVDAGSQGHLDIDQMVFKQIDLSGPIAAVNAASGQLDQAWFQNNYRHLIPAWAGLSMSGIDIAVVDPGDASQNYAAKIADFDLSLSDYLNGIPTKVSSKGTGIDVPIPPNTDNDGQKMLLALGISRVNLNFDIAASWDKASQTINVDKVAFSGNDLGGFALSTVLGNATDKLFDTDPDTATAAGMAVTPKSMKLDISDSGLADKLFPLLAQQQGASDAAAYRTQMAGMAEGAALQMLGSTDAARQLGQAIGDFIAGKAKAVSINVVAKDPAGVPTALFEQASNDPTVLANAVDITGTNPAQ